MVIVELQPSRGRYIKGIYRIEVTDQQLESLRKQSVPELKIFIKRFFRKHNIKPHAEVWCIRYSFKYYSKVNHVLTSGFGYTKKVKLD